VLGEAAADDPMMIFAKDHSGQIMDELDYSRYELLRANKFSEEDVRLVGRSARGVKAIELTDDDIVVGMGIAKEVTKLLTITEDGKGRRTDVSEYRLQTRGGKGVRNFDVEKAGYVAGVRIVNDDDDIILISMSGIIIRMHVSDIAVQSRYANGVKVMRLDADDKAVTFAVTMREDEEENTESETETAEETVTTEE
jgi:DNA gyrase subunit A